MSGTRRPRRTGALAATVVPAVLGALLLSACAVGGQASDLGPEQASRDAASPTTEAVAPASVQVAGSSASPSVEPATPRRTDAAKGSGDLTVRLTSVTRTVSKDGVRATYPTVSATASDDEAADRAEAAVEALVRARVKAFATASAEFADRPAQERFLFVDGTPVVWGHHLTVVLDESAQLSGVHPTNSTHVVVLDRRTGRTVRTADLFTDPAAVDRLIRATLLTTGDPVGTLTPADVAPLSIVPDAKGSTSPLSCWPAKQGLTCTVDQGAVLAHAAGPIPAVVEWDDLADVLRDGVR